VSANIKIKKCKDPRIIPICPSCKNEIREFLSIAVGGGWINDSNVVICPHCRVIIGYGKVNYL
jgi:hypothetical protein